MFLFYFLYYNIPVKVQYVDDNFFVTRFNDIKNREDVLLKYANDIDKILDNFSEDDIDYIQKLYICLTKHDGGNMEELYSKYKEFKLSSEKTLNINDCFTQDFDTKLIINKEKEIDNKIKKLLSLKEENYKEKVEKLRDYQLSLSKISTKEYKEKYIYDI